MKQTDPCTMWTWYRVTWDFLTQLCGSVPAAPELVEKWVRVRASNRKAIPAGRSLDEITEEVLSSLETQEEEPNASLLVFQRSNGVLCVRAATIRAHIKDCSRQISNQFATKEKGTRSFSTRVINGVYEDARVYWVPILSYAQRAPIYVASGERDKAIHIKGPRGEPLDALKRIEYIVGARLVFHLKVLGNSVTERDLNFIFQYGGTHGYGGERGDGEGRYEYQIERLEAEPKVERTGAEQAISLSR